MMVTHSVHPPGILCPHPRSVHRCYDHECTGGATTLIAVLGSHRIHETGFMYVLFPACIGSCIFVTMGLILNNLSSRRERLYPVYWLPFHHPSMFDTTASSGGADSTTTKESTMHAHIDVRGHHYAPSEISLDEEELEMSLPVHTSSPDKVGGTMMIRGAVAQLSCSSCSDFRKMSNYDIIFCNEHFSIIKHCLFFTTL